MGELTRRGRASGESKPKWAVETTTVHGVVRVYESHQQWVVKHVASEANDRFMESGLDGDALAQVVRV